MIGRVAPSVACLAAAAALVACGAPSDSPARALQPVPYGLTATPPPATVPSTPTTARGPQVFLLRDDVLVGGSPTPAEGDARSSSESALQLLVEGPTDQDRTAGLSTALGPEIRLSLLDLVDGRATVDIDVGQQALGAGRLPLAVGQIVLTLTSVDGVDEVILLAEGARIAAPLPGGALTNRPLRAGDYVELTVAPSAPAPGP